MALTTGHNISTGLARAGTETDLEQPYSNANTHTNRLAGETSPYLLQHAQNPVDWYPWGEAAFEKARRENKPIFLSIGYSACHWCHVMERESFENVEVAEILNEAFISIKVDREERPDIDGIYMTAVQMMTGSGGWPLSVFLTPDLKPFFGGTYFPPEDRFGRPGFRNLLTQLAALWHDRPTELTGRAREAAEAITQHLDGRAGKGEAPQPTGMPYAGTQRGIDEAVKALVYSYDQKWGGFGSQPKFPPAGALGLLMEQYARTNDDKLLRIVTHTLDRMAYGGMYDQIGGGFHRYSVDRKWLVPHFEKMLYDNALLSRCYTDAYLLTGRPPYKRIAIETLDYVIRDMSDAAGGFHSSEDADSEGEEGKFYVWDLKQINDTLGPDAALFCRYYGATAGGNFEGKNILNIPSGTEDFAKNEGIPVNGLEKRLAPLRTKMLRARSSRTRPGRDDKVLASWNGLMISSLARGYRALGAERFLVAARKAAGFVLSEMTDNGAGLLHTWRNGKAKIPGYLDDYANTANGFLDLYEACLDPAWLTAAEKLTDEMCDLFQDERGGGFYMTSALHKHLLARGKPYTDSSIPSGNSTAVMVLSRLARLLDRPDYLAKAAAIVQEATSTAGNYPQAFPYMLSAAELLTRPGCEIAITGPEQGAGTRALLAEVNRGFRPGLVLTFLDPEWKQAETLKKRIPLLRDRPMIDGKATAYVCHDQTCNEPTTDATELARQLQELSNANPKH